MPEHHVIYVPGLGDDKPTSQQFAVSLWRLYGVTPHLFQMNWADKELFEPKLERLLHLIDELANEDDSIVSLVGASAGAGAAINAYAARQNVINGVVTICGKFDYPKTIGEPVKRNNPAFVDSMDLVTDSLEALDYEKRARVMSIIPLADESVPIREMNVSGFKIRKVYSVGHAITIALFISLRAGTMIRFLKRRAK